MTRHGGSFLLIDPQTQGTLAAGMIRGHEVFGDDFVADWTGRSDAAPRPPRARPARHESAAGQQVASELLLAVAARLPGVEVHLGWADVLTPTLTETLTQLGDAVVVPGFLTAGYHVTSDLPAAIQAAGGRARLTGADRSGSGRGGC